MWEFMSNYSDFFWKAGENVGEVFTVIMPWALTLGLAIFLIKFILALVKIIIDEMNKRN